MATYSEVTLWWRGRLKPQWCFTCYGPRSSWARRSRSKGKG